jgi:type II secretory pathway pseudopilin PulG
MSNSRVQPKIRKQPFSLIELLVVLSIVISIASVLMTKGADFMRKSQIDSESTLLCHVLNRAYIWAQLEQKPLEILIVKEKDQVKLNIPALKLSKKFSKIELLEYPSSFCFYPNLAPDHKSFVIRALSNKKTVLFNKKSGNFVLELK